MKTKTKHDRQVGGALVLEARDLLKSRRRLTQAHYEAVRDTEGLPAEQRAQMLAAHRSLAVAAARAGKRLSDWDRAFLAVESPDAGGGTYYATREQIKKAHNVDGRTFVKWEAREDWPKKTLRGWLAGDIDKAVLRARREGMERQHGPHSDLREAKLRKEIERLVVDIQLREIERDKANDVLIPREAHAAKLGEFCRLLTDALSLWISEVKVLTGDAKLLGESERLRERVLARLREECGKAAG